jgi:hypothetical protein
MHYQLVAKVSDFTTEELQHKMQGFLVVNDDETVNQYGCWKIARYSDFNEFVEDEELEDEEDYQTFAGRDGILRQYGYAYGVDGKIYEKVSAHFDSFYFKGIERYKNVIKSPQGVYAFISSDGNFYYLTDTRCPFEPNDVVYVMDCHC